MNFLIILLLKATLILIISTLLIIFLQKASASLRHWIISLTFIGLLALPLLVNWLPNWKVEVTGMESLSLLKGSAEKEIPPIPRTNASDNILPEANNEIQIPVINSQQAESTPTIANSSISVWPYLPIVLLTIWLVGFIIWLVKILLGIYKVYKISKLSNAFIHPSLNHSTQAVQLLTHPSIITPMTWGLKKPIIFLPLAAKNWSEETLQTVLTHELAHIQRKDYWIHIASLISAAFYWFHPLVWWLKKQQLIEREKACDEFVLKTGHSSQNYAEQLVQIARQLFTKDLTQPAVNESLQDHALPMAQVKELKGRLHAILNFQKEKFRFNKIKQWQWATFYVSVIVLLGAFTPIEKSAFARLIIEEIPAMEIPQLSLNDAPITLSISSTPLLSESKETSVLPMKQKSISAIEKIVPIEIKMPIALPNIKQLPIPIDLPEQMETQSMKSFTSWTNGKRQYKMWVSGSFHFTVEAPYVEVDNNDDMIIIEEKRRSKTYRGIITKAPYAGAIIQNYQDGIPNSWSGRWEKGDPLYLWTVNGKWKFLSEKERDEWMYEVMQEASSRLQKMQRQNDLFPQNEDWSSVMEAQRKFKQKRFVSSDQIAGFYSHPFADGHDPNQMEDAPKLSSIPFSSRSFIKSSNKSLKKKGFTRANRITTGGNDYSKGGARYGMVIQNFQSCRLMDFNFHLRFNDFEQVDFELNLYRLIGPEIMYRITKSPIPFSIQNGKNG